MVFLALLCAFLTVNRPVPIFPALAHADQGDPAIERLLQEIENAETPLATLGLPSSEKDKSVIRRAYRTRITKFHSDHNGANNPRYKNAAAKLNLAEGALLKGRHETWATSWRNVSPQKDQARSHSSSKTESWRAPDQKCAQAYAGNIRGHVFSVGVAAAFLAGIHYLAKKVAEAGRSNWDEDLAQRKEAELSSAAAAYCDELVDSAQERLKDDSIKLQEICLEALRAISRRHSNLDQILQKCREFPELERQLSCLGEKIGEGD